MKPRRKTEMMAESVRKHTQQRRRDIAALEFSESSIGLFVERSLDERLQHARDIVREIARDGCVGGELS